VSASGGALPAVPAPRTPRSRAGAERALWIFLAIAIPVVLATGAVRVQANPILGVLVVGLVVVAYQRVLLAWQTMLGVILLVILFIPIRRYTVGGGLPIELEPYRIIIGVVLACWLCALAADPSVRWRRSGFEAPMAAVLVVMLLSMTTNVARVSANSGMVVKQFTFFLSYFLLVYLTVSVVRSRGDVDRMLRLLVGGGTVVAALSLVEWRTGSNLFNWYERAIPFLHYVDEGVAQVRGSGVRARGSAQHPIALSAALVMLVPLAVHLHRRDRRFAWLACAGVMTLGALSTGSRTGTTMLIAVLVSFLCIKGRETVRLLPALIPFLVVVQIAMPGTLGTMKSMLDPKYVIREQSYDKGGGAGRVADLGPALDQWSAQPLLGSGFGTRIADPDAREGSEHQILDDQWLGTLLEVGALGVLAWLWLYGRAIRALARRARGAPGADGWLATALAASLLSFAVGMLTFDAYAFVQVTFLSFIMLAIGAAVIRSGEPEAESRQAVRRRPRDAIAAR
jgi:O-antigen ligase